MWQQSLGSELKTAISKYVHRPSAAPRGADSESRLDNSAVFGIYFLAGQALESHMILEGKAMPWRGWGPRFAVFPLEGVGRTGNSFPGSHRSWEAESKYGGSVPGR